MRRASSVMPARSGRRVELGQAAPRRSTGRRTPSGGTAGRAAGTRPPGSARAPGGRCAGRPRGPSRSAAGRPSPTSVRPRRATAVDSSRASMSTRSRLRPRTRKRQASSRLMVESVSPAMMAARSRTKRKKPYGPDPPAEADLAGQGVVGGVEGLPHLRADGLADASGVGPGRGERRDDRAGVVLVEGQELGDDLGVEPVDALGSDPSPDRAAVARARCDLRRRDARGGTTPMMSSSGLRTSPPR